jgi:adenine-specific DNA-methyltransferase
MGYRVWTGDVLRFAHFFQVARVRRHRTPAFHRLRAEAGIGGSGDVVHLLRKATRSRGWFVEEYARKRSYFTEENARKIQGCWCTIRQWASHGWLTVDEHAVLIASLINSMDKVADTAGTYYAFEWQHRDPESFFPTRGSIGCLWLFG